MSKGRSDEGLRGILWCPSAADQGVQPMGVVEGKHMKQCVGVLVVNGGVGGKFSPKAE